MTDFHAWDRALDLEEMIDWTNCAPDRAQGSIVRWDPDMFSVENMTRAEATLDEGSFQKSFTHVIFSLALQSSIGSPFWLEFFRSHRHGTGPGSC